MSLDKVNLDSVDQEIEEGELPNVELDLSNDNRNVII